MSGSGRSEGIQSCSVARTLEIVGEKWSLLIVRELLLGRHRFAQIVERTGAPRDVLTTRLRRLEQRGILHRRRYSERPERFEYHLTELGRSLAPVLAVLRQWGDAHLSGPEGPPARFEHTCGHALDVEVVCANCGGLAASDFMTQTMG
ncbi:winged helix-turn-helix transcriptional regulator [Microbacterium karelineae]|uniref:winged helix-turn-helix transcriptional regulator n=1 Tax=Microbacterium karelineae TaxID=2654283 RepID=UPI0012EAB8F8|nr:helix-turn-helix domain-containing protein [Microbacterium karelineae]